MNPQTNDVSIHFGWIGDGQDSPKNLHTDDTSCVKAMTLMVP